MARVLIIDDSPTETYKLTSMLEKSGHAVITADNAESGIALAKKELPDLVLMDVVMPGLNGFQATRQLTKTPETAHKCVDPNAPRISLKATSHAP